MFTTSIKAAFFFALVASAKPSLLLKASGPSDVTNVDDLKIITSVKNTGDEALKLLNDPRGVLDTYPTESFIIRHDLTGLSPKFLGPIVGYSLPEVIKDDDPSLYTILKPGESIDVTHDLSSIFDFSNTGTGKYTFSPKNGFYYIDPTTYKPIPITATSSDAHISFSKVIVPVKSVSPIPSTSAGTNCTNAEALRLNKAANAAINLVKSATSYTNNLTKATPRFSTWFGPFQRSSLDVVKDTFYKLSRNNFQGYNYRCESTGNLCMPRIYAYVQNKESYGEVHICPFFFNFPDGDLGGFLLHEATHFNANGGASDYAYGEQDCKQLAGRNPNQAIHNADSYRLYAVNNPAQA